MYKTSLMSNAWKSSKHTGGFVLIDFYLLNTRSTNNKVLSIKDYVVNSDLDILATTEI